MQNFLKTTSTSIANRPGSSLVGLALALTAGFVSASCVTVHVNLPESAVQRAADDYVRELYKAKERSKGNAPAVDSETGSKPSASLSNLLFSEAWADDMVMSTPTPESGTGQDGVVISLAGNPKAKAIMKKQGKIADQVNDQKSAGVFGEGNDGYLVLKDDSKLTGPKKVKAEKLMKQENSLRKSLYEEAHGSATGSVKIESIARSFAHSFQDYSPKGTWVQDDQGDWKRKPSDAPVERK